MKMFSSLSFPIRTKRIHEQQKKTARAPKSDCTHRQRTRLKKVPFQSRNKKFY